MDHLSNQIKKQTTWVARGAKQWQVINYARWRIIQQDCHDVSKYNEERCYLSGHQPVPAPQCLWIVKSVSKVRLYILITSQMHVRVAANTHSSLSLLELESHFFMMHTEYYLTTKINISQYPSKSIKFYTIENRQQKICSNLLASKSYLLLKTNTYP